MTDKIYPSSKPNPPPSVTGAAAPPSFAPPSAAPPSAATPSVAPAAKSQLYNPRARPCPAGGPYRPQSAHHSHRRCTGRRFCCLCFIYTLILLLSLLLLAAIAACVFYVLYHPKHPTFSVSSVRISDFNLSSPSSDSGAFSHLASRLDFTLSAKNPNQKITFFYDRFSVNVASSGGIDVGNATLPAFAHSPGNTTILRGTVSGDPARDLDSDSVSALRSDLGEKNGFPLSVKVDTKVEAKMGKLKSKRVGIRVTCDGIRGFEPKRNATSKKTTPAVAATSAAKCKVDLRIKIWRFTF